MAMPEVPEGFLWMALNELIKLRSLDKKEKGIHCTSDHL
jgi:hypothetical protein